MAVRASADGLTRRGEGGTEGGRAAATPATAVGGEARGGGATRAANQAGQGRPPGRPSPPTLWPYLAPILAARLLGAALQPVSDCDEVFNYWEPLHHLLHGYGFQTWEYSAQFALRSHWYLWLHAAVAWPLGVAGSLVAGEAAGKLASFYGTKAALATASALAEARLARAVGARLGARGPVPAGPLAVLLQATSSGLFAAAPALLPSSFTTTLLALATASALEGRPVLSIYLAAAGIVWGWAVTAIAFLPLALSVLVRAPPTSSVPHALLALACTAGPLALADVAAYGRRTLSIVNFVRYNVSGGGDSALYGVEPWWYYLRNGAVNLQLALPLGLAAPVALLLRRAIVRRPRPGSASAGAVGDVLVLVVLPCYLWLAAISALPHKEERFLFPVYPLLATSAAVTLSAGGEMLERAAAIAASWLGRPSRAGRGGGRPSRAGRVPPRPVSATRLAVRALALAVVSTQALLGLSRAVAVVVNYGAPMRVLLPLAAERADGRATPGASPPPPATVCLGAEWHRYPSSFFLPSAGFRPTFVDPPGFDGLLPRLFDEDESDADGRPHLLRRGFASSPPTMNDRNEREASHALRDAGGCSYFVTARDDDGPGRGGSARPHDLTTYLDPAAGRTTASGHRVFRTLLSLPFLDNPRSPDALGRALYLPGRRERGLRWLRYELLKRE